MITLTEDVRACLAQLVEALNDAVLLVDQGGVVHFANRAARAALDLPAEGATLGPTDPWQHEVLQLMHRLPAEDVASDVHVAGSLPRVLEGYAAQQQGEFWGGIFVVRPGPAQRRELPAERASDFAHEVKNALHSLLLNVYMLRKWAASRPYVETQTLAKFDLVSGEIHRLNGLAENLLLDARPRVRHEAIRLSQLLGDVMARVSAAAREAGIVIRSRLPAELAPVQGDARLLHEAFLALLDSRLEALGEGGELEIQAGVGDKQALVVVSDSGPGIGNALDAHGGRGLGLTDWVVRSHGGSFETFSASGLGNTVVVKLPLIGSAPSAGQTDLGRIREA